MLFPIWILFVVCMIFICLCVHYFPVEEPSDPDPADATIAPVSKYVEAKLAPKQDKHSLGEAPLPVAVSSCSPHLLHLLRQIHEFVSMTFR